MTNDQPMQILITDNAKELVIRHGDAEKIIAPQRFSIVGKIHSPLKFLLSSLGHNSEYLNKGRAVVVFSKKTLCIELHQDPTHPLGDLVVGALLPAQNPLKVNTGEQWRPLDLASFLRKNRDFFKDPALGAAFISELQSLKITSKGEIESSDDKRGGKVSSFSQAIQSNLPTEIVLNLEIFEGHAKAALIIQVYFEVTGQSVLITLESSEFESEKTKIIDSIFDEQIKGFEDEKMILVEI